MGIQETTLSQILEKMRVLSVLTYHLQLQKNKLATDFKPNLIPQTFQDGLSSREIISFQILELIKTLLTPKQILSGLKKILNTLGNQNTMMIRNTGRTCQLLPPIPAICTNHSLSHLQKTQKLPELQTELIEKYGFNYNYLSANTIVFYL